MSRECKTFIFLVNSRKPSLFSQFVKNLPTHPLAQRMSIVVKSQVNQDSNLWPLVYLNH